MGSDDETDHSSAGRPRSRYQGPAEKVVEALLLQFKAHSKPMFIKYQEKGLVDGKALLEMAPFLAALLKLQDNLSFRQNMMYSAIMEAGRSIGKMDVWFHSKDEEKEWADVMSRRVRHACRHVSQALLKPGRKAHYATRILELSKGEPLPPSSSQAPMTTPTATLEPLPPSSSTAPMTTAAATVEPLPPSSSTTPMTTPTGLPPLSLLAPRTTPTALPPSSSMAPMTPMPSGISMEQDATNVDTTPEPPESVHSSIPAAQDMPADEQLNGENLDGEDAEALDGEALDGEALQALDGEALDGEALQAQEANIVEPKEDNLIEPPIPF